MTANGVTEKLWAALNLAQKVLGGGWGGDVPLPVPSLRSQGKVKKTPEGLKSLMDRYGGQGTGPGSAPILAVTGETLLDQEETDYFAKWLEALGLKVSESVYFVTAPQSPGDREILEGLSQALEAKVVFTLGELSAQRLLGKKISLPILRGQDYKVGQLVILPTFHPRQVLQDQNLKKPVWEDLKRLKGIIAYG